MTIGFIGLGIMGESMCENVIKKSGSSCVVYDVNSVAVEKMKELGAAAGSGVSDVARQSDVIITMLPKSEHVRAVVEEMLPELGAGKIVIDMSTIDPSVSVELADKVKQTGAVMLDAPVVKSKPAAIEGTLGILVGGDEVVFEKVKPILLYIGCNVIRMGGNGAGLIMKVIHNMLVAQIQAGVNEMLTLANSAGIDIDDAVTAISYGGGQNFYLDGKKNAIKNRDFTTAFSVENMHKDVHIAERLISEMGLELPGAARAVELYDKAMSMGIGKEDFSAMIKVTENNNVK